MERIIVLHGSVVRMEIENQPHVWHIVGAQQKLGLLLFFSLPSEITRDLGKIDLDL